MSTNKGFTLVEVLVVIAIISLLLGILVPALGGAKARARELQCTARLTAIGRGLTIFADGSDGGLPVLQWYQGSVADRDEPGYIDQYAACRWGRPESGGKDNGYWCNLGSLYEKRYIDNAQMFYCPATDNWNAKYKAYCNSQSGLWGDGVGGGYVFGQYIYWPQSKTVYTGEQLSKWLAGATGNYVAGMPMSATRMHDLDQHKPISADYSFHSHKGKGWDLNVLFPDGHVILQTQPQSPSGAGLWHSVDQWADGEVVWSDGRYIWNSSGEQDRHTSRPVPIVVFMSALQS